LGISWKLGWIPLGVTDSRSGEIEVADQTSESDSTSSQFPAEIEEEHVDLALTADQGEPPTEEGFNSKSELVQDEMPLEETVPEQSRFVRGRKARPKSVPRPVTNRRIQPVVYQDEPLASEEESTPAEMPVEPKRVVEESQPAEVSTTDDRFAEIDAKLAEGEFLAAHKLLSKLYWKAKVADEELQTRLEASANRIFFSPQPHFIEPHVVQSGDQLRKIATKYGLSWEYLAKLNKTDPRRIREGQKLKVLKGPFAAIVNLHDFSLTIHLQGYYVKRYQVGIGKDGSSPIGKFPVLTKLENPQYTDPDGKVIEGDDPANPLGERWIDLGDSYGIHGTIDPDSIGKAASRGCIRLRDADIIEVYNFLVPGSVVEIRE